MSNIDNFDIDQMSSKFAQRQYFASYFYCKKNFILGSLDDAENAKYLVFFTDSFEKKLQNGCFLPLQLLFNTCVY